MIKTRQKCETISYEGCDYPSFGLFGSQKSSWPYLHEHMTVCFHAFKKCISRFWLRDLISFGLILPWKAISGFERS